MKYLDLTNSLHSIELNEEETENLLSKQEIIFAWMNENLKEQFWFLFPRGECAFIKFAMKDKEEAKKKATIFRLLFF